MSNSLFSQHTRLSEEVFKRFMDLPLEGEEYQAEYICKCWLAACRGCVPACSPALPAGTITACARAVPRLT